MTRARDDRLATRRAPLEMGPDEFRARGHELVEQIADLLESLPARPVTRGVSPRAVRAALGDDPLPAHGTSAEALLGEVTSQLFEHSLYNGHPRFFGYITASPAPIGILADFLASAVNPNLGAWLLSPVATEIEAQTVRWIAELVGYPRAAGGILVSGGNVANFVGFLAGRRAKAPWDIRASGLRSGPPLAVYLSTETHTWIHKAADLFGQGLDAVRWIPVDARRRMDTAALERAIVADREHGVVPLLAVGAAGTVEVGAVDPLGEIAAICRAHGLWFHVDGAYGALAAALPDAPEDLRALSEADSVALDPQKWLYSPLEAGCVLVKEPKHLADAFSFHPEYYEFGGSDDEPPINYYELGLQNSRGFRALKVWLALRHAGREGYEQMIHDDIALAQALNDAVTAVRELEPFACNLSITTFRFVPADLEPGGDAVEEYLNDLNREIVSRLQKGGEAFLSNAVVDGRYLLRACIVNFRTRRADVEALAEIVVRLGREVDGELRPEGLPAATEV